MTDEQYDPITAAALCARRGDSVAAAAFVRATQADVWRTCSHLGPRELADDLTQETYARAFAALHRFAGRSSARTWLLGIARHVCVDAVRAAVRRRAHDGGDVTVLATLASRTTADPADAVTTRALLEALSPERREALVLTQVVGLSYAEAAEICRCPVGTIRSRVARGREDLLGGYGEESVAR